MFEKKKFHLEMVQGIINRMGSNSFSLKGWAVTLVAGIFALAAKDANLRFFLVAYIPIVVFWGLDAYYLQQERKFRSLYDTVRNMTDDQIDFSMKISLSESERKKCGYLSCLLSTTELWFYFPLALLSALIICLAFV